MDYLLTQTSEVQRQNLPEALYDHSAIFNIAKYESLILFSTEDTGTETIQNMPKHLLQNNDDDDNNNNIIIVIIILLTLKKSCGMLNNNQAN